MRSSVSSSNKSDTEIAENSGARVTVLGWPAFANRDENPYTALLSDALIELGLDVQEFSLAGMLSGRASILHTHWKPTSRIRGKHPVQVAVRAAGLLLRLQAARLLGTRVVWTAHNLESHDTKADYPRLERIYWRLLPRVLDAVISLSPSAVPLLHARYEALKSVPTFVVPHGHYRGVYPQHTTRDEARARFGIDPDANVYLFLGQIRPYKNVIALLRAFRELDDPKAVLLIGGMVKLRERRAEFDALVAADPRVRLEPRFVAADELQYFFAAADLAVLPFVTILNSGSAILALSFDRPVLVPAIGSLVDLQNQVGSDWVITYSGDLTARTLQLGMHSAKSLAGQAAPLDALEWSRIAEQTRDVYYSILGKRAK